MSSDIRLSKSRYVAGLQCHRLLWWRVHEPDAPELVPDAQTQAIFDQGTSVGELARTYVPGGTLIALPYDRIREKVEATEAALAAGARVLYEASFFPHRVFVAVDILERLGRGFGLIEVKSSTSVKPEHVPDAAIQASVLASAGLDVRRVEIMHLDRACTFPDLSGLFRREDVSERVAALLPGVPAQVREQLRTLAGPLPAVPIGPHCSVPYECPFRTRCWAGLPEHHVSTLYRMTSRYPELEAQGYRTIHDLPAGLGLHPAAERQRRAVQAGALIVEPSLREALARLRPPLAFLDFETINPAVPVWNGCHPYDAIPVQFSCHRPTRDGHDHVAWLAEGPADPRPGLAEALVSACEGARTVLTYNASFEGACLRRLASSQRPALAVALGDVDRRLVDVLPLVRDHVYHPDFGGSFSLKSVLPVLVPGLGYEDMEVAEGGTASAQLERLLLHGGSLPAQDMQCLREALLRYCERDTWGTVRLVDRLRELAGAREGG
jgi:predicted RecB family nuclease